SPVSSACTEVVLRERRLTRSVLPGPGQLFAPGGGRTNLLVLHRPQVSDDVGELLPGERFEGRRAGAKAIGARVPDVGQKLFRHPVLGDVARYVQLRPDRAAGEV